MQSTLPRALFSSFSGTQSFQESSSHYPSPQWLLQTPLIKSGPNDLRLDSTRLPPPEGAVPVIYSVNEAGWFCALWSPALICPSRSFFLP